MARGQVRLFFGVDFHGSDRVFRKWLRAAAAFHVDALVFGGDIAGKLVVPITRTGKGDYRCELFGKRIEVTSSQELENLETRLRSMGRYPVVVTEEERVMYDQSPALVANELFPKTIRDSLQAWVELAEETLAKHDVPAYIMLGNDDYPDLAPLLTGKYVRNCEGLVEDLPGGFQMISFGYSNRTPWDSPREMDEDDLEREIDAMAEKLSDPSLAVFNLHCPPYGTQLDQAALLDADLRPRVRGGQVITGPVGSTAVRAALTRYQPLLGLHGHIHESPGVQKLGRSMAINPGSDYGDGVLRGAIVTLDRGKGLRSWQLVQL